MSRQIASNIAVKAGQVYRARRTGGIARHVRVLRINRRHHPPSATLVECTRSGRPKRGAESFGSTLTWRNLAWRLRSGYELVEVRA